jgi:hypothetical protein
MLYRTKRWATTGEVFLTSLGKEATFRKSLQHLAKGRRLIEIRVIATENLVVPKQHKPGRTRGTVPTQTE